MHYVTFWKGLQFVAGLEKLAASDDVTLSQAAQRQLAATCDDLFSSTKTAGSLVSQMLSFRTAHQVTGEKLAASPDATADLLQKLATAEYVDGVLEESFSKLSGDEYAAARAVQLLGREYAVQLMRGLLA
jgi:argininosuccinate lyase